MAMNLCQAQPAATKENVDSIITLSTEQIYRHEFDSTLLNARIALQLARQIDYTNGLGDANMRMAVAWKNKSEYDSAIACLKRSIVYRRQVGDPVNVASSLMTLGNTYCKRSDYDSAVIYLIDALKIFEVNKTGNNKNDNYTAKCNLNLASVYIHNGDYNNAKTYSFASLKLAAESRDTFTLSANYGNLSSIYYKQGMFDSSKYYSYAAMKWASNSGNLSQLSTAYNNLGLTYKDQTPPLLDSALAYLIRSAELDSILDDDSKRAIGLSNIGLVYTTMGHWKQAIQSIERSIGIGKESGNENVVADGYKYLAAAFDSAGMYDSAYYSMMQHSLFHDSVFNREKTVTIQNMETRYQTEKKVQENKILSARNNALVASAIALLILAIGIFIFYFLKQQIAQRNSQIQQQQISELLNMQEIKSLNALMEGQEKERKRLAADLHDRVGSSLAAIKLHFTGFTRSVDKHVEDKQQLTRLNSMFDDVIKEVRQVSHDLSSGVLSKFGLVSALNDLGDSIESSGTVRVHVYAHGLDERINHLTEISLYRIVQELLSNTLKHAQAKEINIHLTRHDQEISLMVEDDGLGFDTHAAAGGIGMKNIRSRVNQLHGNVFFDSAPGNGCTVSIDVPLNGKP